MTPFDASFDPEFEPDQNGNDGLFPGTPPLIVAGNVLSPEAAAIFKRFVARDAPINLTLFQLLPPALDSCFQLVQEFAPERFPFVMDTLSRLLQITNVSLQTLLAARDGAGMPPRPAQSDRIYAYWCGVGTSLQSLLDHADRTVSELPETSESEDRLAQARKVIGVLRGMALASFSPGTAEYQADLAQFLKRIPGNRVDFEYPGEPVNVRLPELLCLGFILAATRSVTETFTAALQRYLSRTTLPMVIACLRDPNYKATPFGHAITTLFNPGHSNSMVLERRACVILRRGCPAGLVHAWEQALPELQEALEPLAVLLKELGGSLQPARLQERSLDADEDTENAASDEVVVTLQLPPARESEANDPGEVDPDVSWTEGRQAEGIFYATLKLRTSGDRVIAINAAGSDFSESGRHAMADLLEQIHHLDALLPLKEVTMCAVDAEALVAGAEEVSAILAGQAGSAPEPGEDAGGTLRISRGALRAPDIQRKLHALCRTAQVQRLEFAWDTEEFPLAAIRAQLAGAAAMLEAAPTQSPHERLRLSLVAQDSALSCLIAAADGQPLILGRYEHSEKAFACREYDRAIMGETFDLFGVALGLRFAAPSPLQRPWEELLRPGTRRARHPQIRSLRLDDPFVGGRFAHNLEACGVSPDTNVLRILLGFVSEAQARPEKNLLRLFLTMRKFLLETANLQVRKREGLILLELIPKENMSRLPPPKAGDARGAIPP